jgi:tetratricopeptide (TPR) repeat protein
LRKYNEDILEWEKSIKKEDKILTGGDVQKNAIFDSQPTVKSGTGKPIEVTLLERKRLAENEKIKGNDFMKTKEYDEAIKFYSSSIKYDPSEATTYCNRALAYIKIKQFDKGVEDCNKAVGINKSYTKAYYRRALCNMGINKYREAFDDLLIVLNDSPDSQEVADELSSLKSKWRTFLGPIEYSKLENQIEDEIQAARKPENKSKLLNKSDNGFKKIKIVEDIIEDPDAGKGKLVEKFKEFAKSGPEIKKQIDDLVEIGKYEEAVSLAREKLAICQNFMREFSNKSNYYSTLEIIVNDINGLIDSINKKSETKKQPVEETPAKKFYKTKIHNEEILESASKIAMASINFDDYAQSSSGFLSAYQLINNNSELFYKYLAHLGSKLENIYKTVEMPCDILVAIANCLKANLKYIILTF